MLTGGERLQRGNGCGFQQKQSLGCAIVFGPTYPDFLHEGATNTRVVRLSLRKAA